MLRRGEVGKRNPRVASTKRYSAISRTSIRARLNIDIAEASNPGIEAQKKPQHKLLGLCDLRSLFKGFGATDDFQDFLGDRGLSLSVGLQG